MVSANSVGLSLGKKYKPPAAANPPKIHRPATIAITRGAMLFDSDVDVAVSEGPASGEGDVSFEGGAAGSDCAAMTSESGFQPAQPLVIGVITRLQHTLLQKAPDLLQGVWTILIGASGNENLHKGLISIYPVF